MKAAPASLSPLIPIKAYHKAKISDSYIEFEEAEIDPQAIAKTIDEWYGKDISILDVAKLIAKVVGFKGEIKHNLSKPDGTPRKLLDVSKINAAGWKHKTSSEEGIRISYNWYLTQK